MILNVRKAYIFAKLRIVMNLIFPIVKRSFNALITKLIIFVIIVITMKCDLVSLMFFIVFLSSSWKMASLFHKIEPLPDRSRHDLFNVSTPF